MEKNLLALKATKLEEGKSGNETPFRDGSIYAYAEWVKYILTTANTWRTPIKDFELIVVEPDTARENPQPRRLGTSVCWEGSVERLDEDRLVARKTDYIPTRELAVYYFLDRD